MNHINLLKLKTLFKEYDYYISDLEWKNYLTNQNEKDFLEFINTIMKNNEEIDFGFEMDITSNEESITSDGTDNKRDLNKFNINDIEKVIEHKEKSPKMKRLYRSIVKITHPDKNQNDELNQIYLKSTKYYNDDDLLNIYRICNDLGINYELEEHEEGRINNDIKTTKNRITFVENSFVYKWTISDEQDRYIIGLEYLNELSKTVNQV